MTIFSNRLKKLRTDKSISQKDMANMLGMTVNAYQKYEYGTREPNFDTLTQIADYFNVPIDYLLGKGIFYNWELVLDLKETIFESLESMLPQFKEIPLDELPETTLMRFLDAVIDRISYDIENHHVEIFYKL